MNNQIANAPNPTDAVSFGRFIECCRKQRNITRDILAKFLNIDKNQLYSIECGQNTIDPHKFPILSGVLDVDVREIYSRYYNKCA